MASSSPPASMTSASITSSTASMTSSTDSMTSSPGTNTSAGSASVGTTVLPTTFTTTDTTGPASAFTFTPTLDGSARDGVEGFSAKYVVLISILSAFAMAMLFFVLARRKRSERSSVALQRGPSPGPSQDVPLRRDSRAVESGPDPVAIVNADPGKRTDYAPTPPVTPTSQRNRATSAPAVFVTTVDGEPIPQLWLHSSDHSPGGATARESFRHHARHSPKRKHAQEPRRKSSVPAASTTRLDCAPTLADNPGRKVAHSGKWSTAPLSNLRRKMAAPANRPHRSKPVQRRPSRYRVNKVTPSPDTTDAAAASSSSGAVATALTSPRRSPRATALTSPRRSPRASDAHPHQLSPRGPDSSLRTEPPLPPADGFRQWRTRSPESLGQVSHPSWQHPTL